MHLREHAANLTFAERKRDGPRARSWSSHPDHDERDLCGSRQPALARRSIASFGFPASRLADAYIYVLAYLLDSAPKAGEFVGWSESNAVIFANSVLGARTAKHADFLDLCIALTGRGARCPGVYLDSNRKARRVIDVERPGGADDSFCRW